MTRRKFSREFMIEAVRLVTDRGVAVAQAARDLDVAESVLRRWFRDGGPDCHWSEGRPDAATPATSFPGNGQMRADLAEPASTPTGAVNRCTSFIPLRNRGVCLS